MAKKKTNELTTFTSSDLSEFIYSPLSDDLAKPFTRQIFLTHVAVAGCNHVKNIAKYISEMKKGDRVTLLREPKNPFDELAILVKDAKNRKLGYVPRAHNHVIARLMDAGKLIYGVVDRLRGPEDGAFPWKAIVIEIYMED